MINNYLTQFAATPTHYGERPRAGTLSVHRTHLERFARLHPGEAFSVTDAKAYVLAIIEAKQSASSVNHALAALDGYIEYLCDQEALTESALKSWRTFKRKSHKTWRRRDRHRKYLPLAAVSDLLHAIDREAEHSAMANRDIALCGLILFGPCRGGEALQLDLTDIVFYDGSEEVPAHWLFRFRAEITKDHEQKEVRLFAGESQIGDIDLFDRFTEYLRWRRTVSQEGAVFVRVRQPHSNEAISRQNTWKLFRTYCRAAGLHATPHWLRHTFGEQTGGRLEARDVRQMFGHSSDQTTQGYTDHDNDDRLIRAQLQAARLIRGTDNPTL